MVSVSLNCSYCNKSFTRPSGRYNEAIKFGWRQFCSPKCLAKSKFKQVCVCCGNCGRKIWKKQCEVSIHNYCSHSCAVIVNNKTHPRNPGVVKICAYCGNNFKSREKYCSAKCQNLAKIIPASKLLSLIKDFVKGNDRIPYKYEIPHYHAYRDRFGTWNKAIETAGFKPNPVMFAKKYIAKDGDKCDSMVEKIIDDYFSRRNIKHIRNFPYPGNEGFTVDFKVGNFWIEFFGLSGQLKKYDQLKRRKLKLARKNKLKLIEIYPKDIFPKSNLNNKLLFLLDSIPPNQIF
jgi:hypothetical protein